MNLLHGSYGLRANKSNDTQNDDDSVMQWIKEGLGNLDQYQNNELRKTLTESQRSMLKSKLSSDIQIITSNIRGSSHYKVQKPKIQAKQEQDIPEFPKKFTARKIPDLSEQKYKIILLDKQLTISK